MSPFGRYLATLRLHRRVKQKDLANAVGVHPCYISLIESGKKSPPPGRLINLITLALDLQDDEAGLLRRYADESIKVMHVPEDLPMEGYAFIYDLRKSLKLLSIDDFKELRSIVSMNKVLGEERMKNSA
ncbi:helix-turn-helix domain-containing protein [Neptuniibacter sp. 1_MG-2023]|uniref:helix-turn-helix domain-containing protein n=1 Tax=Neptuniibacter sp. 1_MG-2023 TaxID=3062662 RepID=UPI0026E149B0|nr:helix-turn-helix transcriptional regulator [Neptuniibacter sp. 1_MG-2023]MDO6594116.1 helix-turn-helix transcriptional regulator [Neptuniibacter sp. 1_MG-2023]